MCDCFLLVHAARSRRVPGHGRGLHVKRHGVTKWTKDSGDEKLADEKNIGEIIVL